MGRDDDGDIGEVFEGLEKRGLSSLLVHQHFALSPTTIARVRGPSAMDDTEQPVASTSTARPPLKAKAAVRRPKPAAAGPRDKSQDVRALQVDSLALPCSRARSSLQIVALRQLRNVRLCSFETAAARER